MKDLELPQARPSRRTLRTCLGPLVLLEVEMGYSTSIVGRFYGRINVPGNPEGYLYARVSMAGATLFCGCVQLS